MAEKDIKLVISADDRTGSALTRVRANLDSMGGAASDLQGRLAGLGATLGVGMFAALIKSGVDAADQMDETSQRVGVAVESLSALKYAGEMSGVQFDALSGGLKKLTVNMNEFAVSGNGEAADALRELGISVTDASGALRSSDAVFEDIAEQFAGMDDGARKTALAVSIFGRSGNDLIPMLNEGSEGLRSMREEAESLGLVMSADMARAAAELNDDLDRLRLAGQGVGIQMAAQLVPTLGELAQAMTETTAAGSSIAQIFGDAIRIALETVVVVAANVVHVFNEVGREIGAMMAQVAALAKLDIAGFNAISEAVKEDAERAREALEAFERRVMNAGQNSAIANLANAPAETYGYDPFGTAKPRQNRPFGGSGDVKKSAADPLASLLDRLAAADSGVSASYWKDLETLNKAYVAGKLGADAYATAVGRLTKEQRFAKDLARQDEEAQRALIDAYASETAALQEIERQRQQSVTDYGDLIDKLELETKTLGMSSAERERYIALKKLDNEYTRGLIQTEEDYLERIKNINEAFDRRDIAQASADAASQATESWNKAAADIEKSITDSLMRGFESGKGFAENMRDTVVNMFKTLVLRPVVQFGVQGALSAVGLGSLSGAANAAQTVGSAGNLLNAGKGVLDLFNGGFSAPGSLYSTFATSGLGASLGLSSYGALSASSIGTGASLGFGGLGASGATAGSGATLTSLGSTLGTALPWIGAALAVASLFGGKRGGPKFEGSTLYDFSDDAFKLPSTVGGEDRDRDGGRAYAEQLTQATFAGVEATINAIGGNASDLAARFGFNRDGKGDAPQNIGTSLYKDGSLVYQSYNDYGREDAEFAKGVELELKKLTVAAIGAAEGLPPIFGKIVSGVDLVSASSEQLDAVLTQLSDSKAILDYASFDPFEQYNAALKAQESGLTGAWDTQRQAVEKLIQSFDGSASATSALAGGIRSLAEIEAQAVAYINQSIAALRSNTQADAEGMYLGTLDNQAQYNYRIGLSQRLEDQLATAQSPEQIMALYERLRGNYQSAYGLLSDTQQATEGSKYFGWLNSETGQFEGGYLGDLQAQVEAMLAPFGQTLADAHDLADPDSLAAQIAAAFGNIPDSLDVSAGALASAAGSLQSVAGVLAGITGVPAPEETIEAPVLAIAQSMTHGMDAAVTRFLDAAARMDAAAARMEAATATPLQVQSSVTLNAFVSPGVEVNA